MPRSSSNEDSERKPRSKSKKRKRDHRKRSESSESSSLSSATRSSSSSSHGPRQSKPKRGSKTRKSSTSLKKARKRHRSSSSSPSTHRHKKTKKEKKKKMKKKIKKKKKKEKDKERRNSTVKSENVTSTVAPTQQLEQVTAKVKTESSACVGPSPRVMKPMSKEEWEKQQSVMRHVYDEESGRTRLIKGDGEVMEEIVRKDRHKEINKLSTQGDGNFYASKMGLQ